MDSAEAKEARRRKIRQLEASLFGGATLSNSSYPGDDVIVGLPDLQNVDEFQSQFGQAER